MLTLILFASVPSLEYSAAEQSSERLVNQSDSLQFALPSVQELQVRCAVPGLALRFGGSEQIVGLDNIAVSGLLGHAKFGQCKGWGRGDEQGKVLRMPLRHCFFMAILRLLEHVSSVCTGASLFQFVLMCVSLFLVLFHPPQLWYTVHLVQGCIKHP